MQRQGKKNAKADGVSGQGCEEDVVTATEEEQNQIRTGGVPNRIRSVRVR